MLGADSPRADAVSSQQVGSGDSVSSSAQSQVSAPRSAAAALAGPPLSGSGQFITRVGNSYSGPAGIQGDVPIRNADGSLRAAAALSTLPNGGGISAQNMAAADALAGRQNAESISRLGLGGSPPSFSGVIGQQSGNGNMWSRTPEQQRRDAEVSASSIHRPTAASGRAALAGLDVQDLQEARNRGALDVAQAQEQGAGARALLADQGADRRQAVQEQGLNLRQLIEARRSGNAPAGYRWTGTGALESIPGGPADQKKALTEDQAKSAGYALRMENALKLINDIGSNTPGAVRPGVWTGLNNMLPEGVANQLRPEARQRVEAAQLDALDAALTLNTGAAYTREQLQGLSRSYFAQPGDDEKTVADKQARLQGVIETARLRAGPGGTAMADAAQARGPQGSLASPQPVAVPGGAVAHLRSNPALAAQFDAKYGPGAASRYLTK